MVKRGREGELSAAKIVFLSGLGLSWFSRIQAMEDPKCPMARVLAADCAFCQGDATKAKATWSGCFCWAVSLQNMWVLVQPFQLFSRYTVVRTCKNWEKLSSWEWLCWVDLEGSAGEASWRQGHLGNGTELNLQSKFELSTPNYQEKEKWSWRECKYVEDWTGEGREDVYWIIEHWNGMKWAHSISQIIWCNNRTAWGLVLLDFKKRSYRLLHHFGWGVNLKIDRTRLKDDLASQS